MAVLKSVVNVNSGNTGWTRGDVMTALETVFSNLGWHGGTNTTGVIQTTIPPYTGSVSTYAWRSTSSTPISYAAQDNKAWTVTNNGTTAYTFTQTSGSGSQSGSNYSITCKQGDVLTFNVNATGFYIVFSNTGGYNANYVLTANNLNNYAPTYQEEAAAITLGSEYFANYPTGQGTTQVIWNTNACLPGTYYYVNQTNGSTMTGTITIEPDGNSHGYLFDKAGSTYNGWYSNYQHASFWDYTVPASGGRSAATFRVYRSTSGHVSGIDILNPTATFGWSDNEVFTIPGTATGGSSPTHDIVFGTLATTGNTTTPSIRTTTMGAGTSFYQKNLANGWGVLKLVNDESKTYGTTYYGFNLCSDFPNHLYITSGPSWGFANRRDNSYITNRGPSSSNGRVFTSTGAFLGAYGVDYSDQTNLYAIGNDPGSWTAVQICSTSTPTAYPLAIRVFRAQAPQDTNFAIIQFTQTINNVVNTYGTFFIHKGTGYGNNVWDLNFVYQGGLTTISSSGNSTSEDITFFTTGQTGRHYASNTATEQENYSSNTKTREAFYGYERGLGGNNYNRSSYTTFGNNIYTDNYGEVVTYFRSAADDNKDGWAARPGVYNLSTSANYYKPIKGLPISAYYTPVPYYLPDDYVMINFAVTPAASIFTSGDRIIVTAGVEEYEVLVANYTQNTTGLSGSTVCKGIAFCARIV